MPWGQLLFPTPQALVSLIQINLTVKDAAGQGWGQQHQDSCVIKTPYSPTVVHI